VAERLEPKQVATQLANAMARTTNPDVLASLARALAAVAGRLKPNEARDVCAPAATRLAQATVQTATRLAQAMDQRTEPYALGSLAQCLAAVAGRLEPKEAAEVCAPVAALLAQAIAKTNDPEAQVPLARGLAAVAGRLGPQEAAAACAPAVALITQAMAQATSDGHYLAEALAAVVVCLEPQAAAAQLARTMAQTTYGYALDELAPALAAVAVRLEPRVAAAQLSQAMAKTTDYGALEELARGLVAVLTREPREHRCQRIASLPGAVGLALAPASLPLTVAHLAQALESLPDPLPPALLVEVLKHPLCVGEARRAVLDVLGARYERRFADQWEFVRFAEGQKLGLDFTTPPKRPMTDR
jgi:hypothetical protein